MEREQDAKCILRNTVRMLHRRGLIENEEKTAQEACDTYNSIDNSAQILEPSVKIKLHFDTIKTMGKIEDVVHFVQSSLPSKCILIVKGIASRPFKELISIDNVEIFWMYELQTDLASNMMIPPHKRLTDVEKQAVLAEYSITPKNLPKLDKTDFMVRYMGFDVNDVIEIHRPSITSGISVAYRVVVNCSWDKLFS